MPVATPFMKPHGSLWYNARSKRMSLDTRISRAR